MRTLQLKLIVILFGLVGLFWFFHLSPMAKECFAKGGTHYDIDGTCRQVSIIK